MDAAFFEIKDKIEDQIVYLDALYIKLNIEEQKSFKEADYLYFLNNFKLYKIDESKNGKDNLVLVFRNKYDKLSDNDKLIVLGGLKAIYTDQISDI